MNEIRQGKIVTKAGKLLKIFVDYDEKIRKITITGDFFMHPEEGIETLQKGLEGTPVDKEAIKNRLDELLSGFEAYGFDSEQLANAIAAACGQDVKK